MFSGRAQSDGNRDENTDDRRRDGHHNALDQPFPYIAGTARKIWAGERNDKGPTAFQPFVHTAPIHLDGHIGREQINHSPSDKAPPQSGIFDKWRLAPALPQLVFQA